MIEKPTLRAGESPRPAIGGPARNKYRLKKATKPKKKKQKTKTFRLKMMDGAIKRADGLEPRGPRTEEDTQEDTPYFLN